MAMRRGPSFAERRRARNWMIFGTVRKLFLGLCLMLAGISYMIRGEDEWFILGFVLAVLGSYPLAAGLAMLTETRRVTRKLRDEEELERIRDEADREDSPMLRIQLTEAQLIEDGVLDPERERITWHPDGSYEIVARTEESDNNGSREGN